MLEMIRVLSIILSACWLVNVYAKVDDSAVKTAWGYTGNIGPARWSELTPAFAECATGKEQSPINISPKTTEAPYQLVIKYHQAPLEIMRDGVTPLTIGKEQLLVNTGHGIQVDFGPEDHEVIEYQDKQYRLIQFHLHSPSETQIHGEAFPLEIHFVHQGEDGRLAVIAVFVKGGEPSVILEKIIRHLPNKDGKHHEIKGERVNPARILPFEQNYYGFAGSLTTPPCDEGVQWIVMEQPITASPAQIATLRRAMGGGNARPVQPLKERTVMYSKQGALSQIDTFLSRLLH